MLRHLYFNRCKRYLRAPHVAPLEADDETLQAVAERRPALTETVVLRRHEYRLALDALAALPLMYRAPVLLVDVEELSYQEVARRLNLPLGTVRSRIARGRSRIRQRMSAWTISS
jgi:RNA polymerase sigma-70 factor (ECF subfamily)